MTQLIKHNMKFKYQFHSSTLFDELKKDDSLFWNGTSIQLNDVALLLVTSSFESHKPPPSLDELLQGYKKDYSEYESRIYFYVYVNHVKEYIFDMWKHEFESLVDAKVFDKIFTCADNKLVDLMNKLNDLKK